MCGSPNMISMTQESKPRKPITWKYSNCLDFQWLLGTNFRPRYRTSKLISSLISCLISIKLHIRFGQELGLGTRKIDNYGFLLGLEMVATHKNEIPRCWIKRIPIEHVCLFVKTHADSTGHMVNVGMRRSCTANPQRHAWRMRQSFDRGHLHRESCCHVKEIRSEGCWGRGCQN